MRYNDMEGIERMMYIPKHLRATRKEAVDADPEILSVSDIVRAHYAFSNEDSDFDGGLSLLDALKNTLSFAFHEVEQWDVESMKDQIRVSDYPEDEFMLVLDEILTQDMLCEYGY